MIQLEVLRLWFPVAMSLGTLVFAWFATRRKDVDQRFDDGSKRMDRHDGRLQNLEQKVEGLPAKEDVHTLQLQMSEMSGDMKEMRALMQGNSDIMGRIERIVGRHEDHLLNAGSK